MHPALSWGITYSGSKGTGGGSAAPAAVFRKEATVVLNALLWAAAGTGFTALMTALGSAVVFLFRHRSSPALHRIMLGFAAGVMIAASMWSLLIPAIEKAQEMGLPGWLPAAGGSVFGIGFLLAMDYLLPFDPRVLPPTQLPQPHRPFGAGRDPA